MQIFMQVFSDEKFNVDAKQAFEMKWMKSL